MFHGWGQADGRTYTQFHSCCEAAYHIYKSERNKQYSYYTVEKHSHFGNVRVELPTSAPLPDQSEKAHLDQGSKYKTISQMVQCDSTDGVIYQSTLTKAHFTHFLHFLSWSCFFFAIAEHLEIQKGRKPQSSGFVLLWGLGCMFSLAQKLTKGIGGIHQKEVTLAVYHTIPTYRLFCITNGCTVAFKVLSEYQWAAWSILLSKEARFLLWHKKSHNSWRCRNSLLWVPHSSWTQRPHPRRDSRGEALHRHTGCNRHSLLLASWGQSCLSMLWIN